MKDLLEAAMSLRLAQMLTIDAMYCIFCLISKLRESDSSKTPSLVRWSKVRRTDPDQDPCTDDRQDSTATALAYSRPLHLGIPCRSSKSTKLGVVA